MLQALRFCIFSKAVIYPIFACSLIGLHGIRINWSVIAVFGLGLFYSSFVQYVLHRFIFHYRYKNRRIQKLFAHAHFFHHKYPFKTKALIIPLHLTAIISLSGFIISAPIFGAYNALWFYLAMTLSYLFYEFSHFYAHVVAEKFAYFRFMESFHEMHHKKNAKCNFGITDPLFDIIFKTYERPMPIREDSKDGNESQ